MGYHIAQLNIAKMIAPIDDPVMADFVNNLDRINALAETANGFVWRLKGEDNNATALRVFEDNFMLINVSVWESIASLFEFVYSPNHAAIMKRKNEWFSKMKAMHMVLWYVEEDHIPTPQEAKERLAYIRNHGETPYAFSFKSKFTVEDLQNYEAQ